VPVFRGGLWLLELIQALIPGGKVGDIRDAGPEKGGTQGPQQYVKHNQPPGNASPYNAVILLHPALIFHKIPNKGPQLAYLEKAPWQAIDNIQKSVGFAKPGNPQGRLPGYGYFGLDKIQVSHY
jgi:hypothetical protein